MAGIVDEDAAKGGHLPLVVDACEPATITLPGRALPRTA